MEKRARIISSYYQKGGVGKTALAVNFAACLSTFNKKSKNKAWDYANAKQDKYKVLFIDFDPHYSATAYFNCEVQNGYNIYDVLKEKVSAKETIVRKEYDFGRLGTCAVDIIPSTDLMHNIDDHYYSFDYSDGQLAKVLEDIVYDYDYIIIDCPPEKDNIFKLVFNVTDYFILAADAMTITFERLPQTYSLIKEITTLKEPGKVLGVCFNKYTPSYCIDYVHRVTCADVVEACKQYINVFETKIPNSGHLISSFTNRTPIPFYHDKIGIERLNNNEEEKNVTCEHIYSAFMHLTEEILNEIDKYESEV